MQRPDDNGFLRGGPPQDYLERNIYSSYASIQLSKAVPVTFQNA
jgi:hypothetical protein